MLSPINSTRPRFKHTQFRSSNITSEHNNGHSMLTPQEISQEINTLKDLIQKLRLEVNAISSTLGSQVKALQDLIPQELVDQIKSTHAQVETISAKLATVQSSQNSSQGHFTTIIDNMKGRFQGWLIGVGAISSILSVAVATAIQNLINHATQAAQKVLPQNVISSTLLNLISTNSRTKPKEQTNS